MGSGKWSAKVYDTAGKARSVSGASAFAYTDDGTHDTAHPDLDARGLDGHGVIRESRDSAEHPASLAIAVLFDVTGSMGAVPRQLQKKMPQLLGLLLRKGYAVDPQIMFAAIGDATCDRAPLQAGQFESDNRMDDDLSKLLLEGGGGGGIAESYELGLYFMARRTGTDCWDKRRHRGICVFIGDETAYLRVSRQQVAEHIGDTLQADIPLDEILAEVQERWDVYYIMPGAASHAGNEQVTGFWRKRLGQNFIEVADTDAIPELIALTIGLAEGTTDLTAAAGDLADVGSTAGAVVSRALAPLAAAGGGKGVVAAAPPGALDAPSGNTRL